MSERVDLQEFIGGFVAEAEELVTAANHLLLEIEGANKAGTSKPKAVRDLFRHLHTIKGLAGMVGIEPIVEIAHALETLLRAADRGGGTLRSAAVEVSLRSVKAIGERVRAVAEQRPPAPVPTDLIAAIEATDAGAEQPSAPAPLGGGWETRLAPSERQQVANAFRATRPVYALTFVPSEANTARGVTIATVRTRLGELGDLVKVVPRTLAAPAPGKGRVGFDLLLISDATPAAIAEIAAVDLAEVAVVDRPAEAVVPDVVPEVEANDDDLMPMGRSLVRVELARLDALQEQLSALIVSRFRLERELAAQAAQGLDVRRLRDVAELQARQLRDLRRGILAVRMVRVAEVLEPLQLLVRSLTRAGVKEVRLAVDTRDAELDKSVADRLLPAIIHLVRNAIDHAVETVDERLAAGKPRAGTLRVSCVAVGGNQIELAIGDDGRGIDRAAVAKRARKPVVTDQELLDVITTPGFSTRDTTTQTSGRGLGMDIVRRIAVGELGGELKLETTAGVGTTFRLRVPLTIAIVDVFSFVVGTQSFVAPVTAVDEIFEIDPGTATQPPDPRARGASTSLLERRGRPLSLVSLGALLAIDDGRRAQKALLIHRDGDPLAFSVDRMLGRQEVVVRPLLDPLAIVPGIAGATDLGDGRPVLVLDLVELGGRAAMREGRRA